MFKQNIKVQYNFCSIFKKRNVHSYLDSYFYLRARHGGLACLVFLLEDVQSELVFCWRPLQPLPGLLAPPLLLHLLDKGAQLLLVLRGEHLFVELNGNVQYNSEAVYVCTSISCCWRMC